MTSQASFVAAILEPEAQTPSGLSDPQGRATVKRFDVYRNNVAVSLTEALETGFPVIRRLLGDEFFSALAAVFLRQHQPTSPLLWQYGAEMPAFLAAFPPVQHLPYLADVARLELAQRSAYHAADPAPFDPSILQDLPAERLMSARIDCAPSVRLVASDHPIYGIWLFNTAENAPKPINQPEICLITRPEFDPLIDPVDPAQAAFIKALLDGGSFGTAVEEATKLDPDLDLSATLGLLLSRNALSHLIESEA